MPKLHVATFLAAIGAIVVILFLYHLVFRKAA